MAFRVGRLMYKVFTSRIRNFSRLPRPPKCIFQQRHPGRPFAEPGKPGLEDWSDKTLDACGSKVKTGADWLRTVAGEIKRPLVRVGKKVWDAHPHVTTISISGLLGAFLFKPAVDYFWKREEKKIEIQFARQEFTEVAATNEYTPEKYYAAATNLEMVNKILGTYWKGLKRGEKFKVGATESTILQNVASPEPTTLALKPIDQGPFIESVLNAPIRVFIIVDGMKGCGKTTSMLLLCSHAIQQGSAAIYLKFVDNNKKDDIPEDEVKLREYIVDHPSRLTMLASHFADVKPVVIVLDDFNQFIKDPNFRECGKNIVNQLWEAASTYAARVIFTASEYNLKKAITSFPSRQSTRIVEFRIDPPSVAQLTAFIKEGLKQKKEEGKEGNSDQDIAMYCEVVGTIRDVFDNYLIGNINRATSVRSVTAAALNTKIVDIKQHFIDLCKMSADTEEFASYWSDHCVEESQRSADSKCREITSTRTTIRTRIARVNKILDSMLEKQSFLATELWDDLMCRDMELRNIARHVENVADEFEFHSYVMEVAARTLLQKPAKTDKQRGSETTISYLEAHVKNVTAEQEAISKLLNRAKN